MKTQPIVIIKLNMTMNNTEDKEEHKEYVVRSEECCHTIVKPAIIHHHKFANNTRKKLNSSLPQMTNMNETTSMNTSNNKDEAKSTINLLNLSPKFPLNFPLRLPSFDT
jgi:hypothetical protein